MTYPELVAWRFAFLSGLGLLASCGANAETKNTQREDAVESDPKVSESAVDEETASTEPSEEEPEQPSAPAPEEPVVDTPATPGETPSEPSEPKDPPLCEESDEQVAVGHVGCTNGIEHRPAAAECPDNLAARTNRGPDLLSQGNECDSDADCTDQAYGHCEQQAGQVLRFVCEYGCVTDADCGEQELCSCGADIGECVPAGCKTDADCESGLCAIHRDAGECVDGFGGPVSYLCVSEDDECFTDADCDPETATSDPTRMPSGVRCAIVDGTRTCQTRYLCGIGRPFLVRGTERLAEIQERADWCCAPGPRALARALTTEQQRKVAAEWTQIALMEHASIAAFARFQLQLMGFGAPAELIEATNRALVDETRHAKSCFELASQYSGHAVGPGPLAVEGSLAESDLRSVALNTVLEGCIGETVAAVEAQYAGRHVVAPELRKLLGSIAEDERRHAELAWQFLDWAASREPELLDEAVALAEDEYAVALQTPKAGADAPDDSWLAAQGLVPSAEKQALKLQVLKEVVLPCLSALRASTRAGARSPRRNAA